jgi:hypothetical protein
MCELGKSPGKSRTHKTFDKSINTSKAWQMQQLFQVFGTKKGRCCQRPMPNPDKISLTQGVQEPTAARASAARGVLR